jgi:hypothetical protein
MEEEKGYFASITVRLYGEDEESIREQIHNAFRVGENCERLFIEDITED